MAGMDASWAYFHVHPAPKRVAAGGSTAVTDDHMSADSTHSSGDSTSSLGLAPTVTRYGRTYLRDVPYPLPCDLQEWQRQDLCTYLRVHGAGLALRTPWLKENPPSNVLDIGCGTGYWSALAHDYLLNIGIKNVKFTGIDIIDVCPDLRQQGIDWHFVQHDLRKVPLPFDDGEFDLILMKDMTLALPQDRAFQALFDEALRLLRKGGTLEIWDIDYGPIRALAVPALLHPDEVPDPWKRTALMGAFAIQPGTPFGKPQNSFLQDYSRWVQEATGGSFATSPCTMLTQMLLQEPENLADVGYRRIAAPLGESKGERDLARVRGVSCALSIEQQSVRDIAMMIMVQTIESLEPLLKVASHKTEDEWQRWWTAAMDSIIRKREVTSGECLEVGFWWARRI